MADLTQSIANTVLVFGPADTTLWNSFNWGTGEWATDDDMEFLIGKNIATQTANIAVALTFDVEHTIATQTATISNDLATITLQDSNGYVYIFPSDEDNIRDIASGVFTTVTIGSDGFTTLAVNSTTWSEA